MRNMNEVVEALKHMGGSCAALHVDESLNAAVLHVFEKVAGMFACTPDANRLYPHYMKWVLHSEYIQVDVDSPVGDTPAPRTRVDRRLIEMDMVSCLDNLKNALPVNLDLMAWRDGLFGSAPQLSGLQLLCWGLIHGLVTHPDLVLYGVMPSAGEVLFRFKSTKAKLNTCCILRINLSALRWEMIADACRTVLSKETGHVE